MTDPFVPLFQPAMIEFKNLTLAGLFGLIWRRAQNGTGRCTASHQHMAETLGITVRTIQREIKQLVKNGYIEDHKPEARERMTTHEYSITPKGLALVPDQIGDKTSLNNEESKPIPEENKRQNVVTTRQNVAKNPDKRQSDATKRQNVIQRYKEDSLKDKREDTKEGGNPPPSGSHNSTPKPLAVHAYRKVAKLYPDKALWQTLDEAIGDQPENLEFWEQVVTDWIGCGWRKTNLKGMLDHYKRRELPTTGGETNGHKSTSGKSKATGPAASRRHQTNGIPALETHSRYEKRANIKTGETYWLDSETGERFSEPPPGLS